MRLFSILLVLASFGGYFLCLVSLIRPKTISASFTRKKALLYFGLGSFVLMVIGTIIFPSSPKMKSADTIIEKKVEVSTTSTIVADATTSTKPLQVVAPSAVTSTNPKPTSQNEAQGYRITNVVDGDTLDVEIDGKVERLRLIGLDTPETLDPRKPVQCFGKEASNKAKELLQGKTVTLEADPPQGEKDKYARLLRYIFLPDGQNFALVMIESGYAHEYTYNLPYRYQTEFRAAEQRAREAKRGLWADNTCAGNTTQAAASPTKPQTMNVPTTAPSATTSDSAGPAVKKSKSGICHVKGTTYYDQTNNYSSYDSIQSCLDSDGRLPKG